MTFNMLHTQLCTHVEISSRIHEAGPSSVAKILIADAAHVRAL